MFIDKTKAIESLRELADKQHQRRVWLGINQAKMSSFDETVSELFDDSGLGDALDDMALMPVFSVEIDDGLRKLAASISDVAAPFRSMRPDVVIEDPRMQAIREIAAKILARI